MVACPKCVVNNTLDSAFCKKCGAVLPVAVIEEEQEKLKEIVTKGMDSYQAGNLDEALAIADHSIITNPSYGEAYALKGLIHERRGEYAEALDCYETVVALNPDSTIDKIKLNQLRNAFAQRQAGEPKTDRKGAAILALGVTGFVAACGVIAYGVILNSKETKDVQNTNLPIQSRPLNTTNPGVNTAQNQFQQRDPNKPNQTSDPGDVGALHSNDNNPATDSGPKTSSRTRYDSGRGGDFGPLVIDPPVSNGQIGSTLPNVSNGGGNNGNDGNKKPDAHKPIPEDPPVTQNGGGTGTTVASNDQDHGTYMITPSTNNGGNGTSRNNGSEGSNSGATSNTGRMYQRQGQGFVRSGKTGQAREAYQKAIDAYEKEISSGKGDKEAAQAGLNSCKQALKNLKD